MSDHLEHAFLEDGSQVEIGKRYTVKLKYNETIFKMTLMKITEEQSRWGWVGEWRLYREQKWVLFSPNDIDSAIEGWRAA